VLVLWLVAWMRGVDRRGYIVVQPAGLTLDGRPGADVAVAGRLPTVGVQRRLAAALSETGLPFASLWMRVHGPAFEDVARDNGFWLHWYANRAVSTDDQRHVALYYRDHPRAETMRVAAAGAAPDAATAIDEIGPLLALRYVPAIDYASCRDGAKTVTVPLRVLPHPKRYGDGTRALPPVLPRTITCQLAPGRGRTRVVAALAGGAGTVAITAADARSPAAMETELCVARADAPVELAVEITMPPGATAELDLYDVPLTGLCPG
jgi:hypothetical protein